MEETIREKVLAYLRDNSSSNSKQIAKGLNLSIKQVFDTVSRLKKQGRIIATNESPPYFYSFNEEYDGPIKGRVSKKKEEITSFTEFSEFVIIYIDSSSLGPKMFNNFSNKEELIEKFSELQKSSNLVDIAIYKKVEIIQKLELKI